MPPNQALHVTRPQVGFLGRSGDGSPPHTMETALDGDGLA